MSISQNFPNIRPTLNLDFANTKTLDPRITYTRASTGTYCGADGVLKTASTNQARFDHDPETGESLGLLVEEARTNLITYSQAFNITNYSTGYDGGNFIENATAAPDGTLTASKLIRNAGASGAFWSKYGRQDIPVVSGTVYTISCYLKAAEISTVYMNGDLRDGGGLVISASFTLTGNGTYILGSGTSAQIVNVGNGWYRCSVTGTATATDTEEPGLIVFGTGTSGQGFFAWGFQLEAGAFPTSYIPTPATFTGRASTATYYDASGVIQTAASGVARDNAYFPDENGVFRSAGLLLEAAGTNLALSSEDFSNTSYWNPTGQTITTNAVVAPDGNTTADNIVPSSGTNVARYLYYAANPYSMSASTIYTTSIFVKKNGLRYFALQAHDNGTGSGHRAGFDLDTGTVVTSNNMGSGTGVIASIVRHPNGWYRCIITGTTASTGTTGRIAFSFSSALDANASVSAITADGVNGGYVWGHQVEQNSYATSYIPTVASTVTRAADTSTSATVTRSADVASITGSNFSSWYNNARVGTLFIDRTCNSPGASNATIAALGGPSVFDPNVGLFASGWQEYLSHTSWAVSMWALFGGNLAAIAGDRKKYAIGFSLEINGTNAAVNGVLQGTRTPTNNALTRLSIGGYANTFRRITYYPQRLTDAQLQNLTK